MGIIEPNAANRSRLGAAMGNKDDLQGGPTNEDQAVKQAVTRMLQAATLLTAAADLADDGCIIEHYINSAIRLRDLANSLLPDKPEWPKDGAEIYDIKTKARLN